MKRKKIFVLISITVAILFLGFLYVAYTENVQIFRAYSFDGRIEEITYSNKGFPHVTINGEDFFLQVGWADNHILEVGDSLKKDSGTEIIKLIKKKNGKTFAFDGM